MQIGISTACLYPMELERSLDTLTSLEDIECAEIFFNTTSELEPCFLKKLKLKLTENNIKLSSVHPFTSAMEPFMFFSEYELRFYDMLDFYKRYFDALNYLNVDILVIHGDILPERIAESEFFERFGILAETGKRFGIRVAQENVNRHRSQSVGFINRFRKNLGDLAYFVLDIKQTVRAGEDTFEMINAMGEKIVHVHINDNTKERDCLLPGDGDVDFKKIYNEINKFGISPDWVIEVYRKNFDKYNELKTSLNFLREKIM